MDFVGVRVVEQLGDDWAKAGRKKKPSKAAKETGDIPKKARLVYPVFCTATEQNQNSKDMP